jgi:peptidoglycan/LPS O-acetylase OafA/YrhL
VYLISEANLPEPIARVFKGGAYGVFFFLTLSGYLLFRPFARHLIDGVPGLRLRDYALNRALRILPLYFFAVAVLLGLEVNGGLPRDWWRFALFIENFAQGTVLRADSPMWSLVVEIHFYIVLPVVAFLVARVARGSRSRAAVAIAVLGLVSLVLRLVHVSLSSAPDFRWTFSLATLFYFFAVGMLLALLRLAWEERPPRWLTGRLASADLWMLASVPLWVVSLLQKEFELAIAAAAFLVLAACVLPLRAGLLTRALEWRPLAVLGIASYSLYIWHVPLITTVADNHVRFPPPGGRLSGHPHDLLYVAVAALPVCVAVALASYATIESPFLRLRRQWAARTGARGATVPDQAPSGQPLEGATSPKRA